MSDEKKDLVKKEITVGEKLFEFSIYSDWCNTAPIFFERELFRIVCIDQKGRICTRRKHFERARDDNSFPIEVFLIE